MKAYTNLLDRDESPDTPTHADRVRLLTACALAGLPVSTALDYLHELNLLHERKNHSEH